MGIQIAFALAVGLVATRLVTAGLSKVARPRPLATTLFALGLRGPLLPIARFLGLTELAAGLSFCAFPRFGATEMLVGALYLSFAASGVIAIRRKASIRCNCDGFARSDRPLGWHQVAQSLPIAGLLAALRFTPPRTSTEVSLLLVLGVVGVVNVTLIGALGPTRRELYRQRRAYLDVSAAMAAIAKTAKAVH